MNGEGQMIGGFAPAGIAWGRSSLPAMAGLAVPLVMITGQLGEAVPLRLALIAVLVLAIAGLFAWIRKLPLDLSGLVSAMLLAVVLPADAPLHQVVLGVVFGMIIGEQVFGGRGRSFLHPAVVTLAFLAFSFTGQDYRTGPDLEAWTLLPALVLLVLAGQASWRIVLAAAGMVVLGGWWQGLAEPWSPLLNGPAVLVLIYLAADPVASAGTNAGRWLHGALVGGLIALLATSGPLFGAAIFAVLLASVFAPLIDRGVIMAHTRWRERRHG